ncbi:MAG: hypothetical protein ABL955_07260, partial [Elusimicrobiota bacterium]
LTLIASASLLPVAAAAAAVPSDRHGLNWEQFAASSTRAKINGCRLVNDLDVLTLYYGMSGSYSAAEFAYYFPDYRNARDEFDRRKVEPQIIVKLRARRRELAKEPLCAKITDVPVGDYDFATKRFPLTHHGGLFGERRGVPGIRNVPSFEDHSKSADDVVNQVNAMAKLKSSASRWKAINSIVDFVNSKDTSLFPAFVAMDEKVAQKAASEFGTLDDDDARGIAKALGAEYKPERTIIAYVLFQPESAATEDGVLMGLDYKSKSIKAKALAVVLATDKGRVIGVSRPARPAPAQAAQPAQEAPTTPAQPSAAPPAKTSASEMSLDELNQYLNRSKSAH